MSRHERKNENPQPVKSGRKARRQERANRRSNTVSNILLVLCLGIFIFAGYKLTSILLEYKSGDDEYAALESYAPAASQPAELEAMLQAQLTRPAPESTTPAAEGETEGEETTEPAPPPEEKSPLPLMDFTELAAINPDVKAWINIFGTNINYPVVQTDNDTTYLKRTFEGKTNTAGCLFFSQYNDLFNDANTVIYGHHMRNGSMFQNLVKYGDEEFFNSHRLGLLYTPGKTYWLEIIAAYITPADSGFDQVIFDSEEAEKNYFRTLLERDDHEIAYSVDELGPILTLSTCTYEYNNARYIVQARIHE